MSDRFFITVALLSTMLIVRAELTQQHVDRAAYYKAMASSDPELVGIALSQVKASSKNEQDAFEGALMMKKAGLVSNSKNKLNLFKSGRNKLETVLAKDSTNAEWRFLRLMIQEHAPKILNYRRELDRDSQFIIRFFKSLPPVVQQAVRDYSKNSRVLNPALFN